MAFKDMKISEFVSTLSSSDPVPGGGTAAALSGALGVGLLVMVGNITMGKKKPEDKTPIEASLSTLKPLIAKFDELCDEDSDAFNEVMSAFKLPKESDSEKAFRREAIEAGTIIAADVPMVTARTAVDALSAAGNLAKSGSKSAISDVACGILFLETAFKGAIYNVEINISGLSDESLVEKYRKEIAELSAKMKEFRDSAIGTAEMRLG